MMFFGATSDFKKEEFKSKDLLIKELKILRAQLALLEEERNARRKAEEETDLLKSLIVGISEVENLDSALAIALRKVCDATGWVIGQAWIPNSEGKYLISSPAWYAKEKSLEKFRLFNKDIKFNPGVGLPGRVWLLKHPIWVKDISLESTIQGFMVEESGLRSWLGVPILSKNNEVIAVIEFFKHESEDVDAHLVSLISVVAAQLGSVIERRKIEDELKKLQERFFGIYNSSKDAIGYCSLEGFLMDVNDSFVTLTGYSREELLSGKKYKDITPPEYYETQSAVIKRILQTGMSAEYEKEYIRKDGSRISVHLTSFLVRDKNNLPLGFASIVRDITEFKKAREELKILNESLEKRVNERTHELLETNQELEKEIKERLNAENALKVSEEKYRKLIETANDAIFIADAETGIIIDVNKQAGKLLDMDIKEIIGMHQAQLHPKEDTELYKKAFIKDVQNGAGISDELYVCNRHGEKIPVEISASVLQIGNKKIIQGIFRDLRKWREIHHSAIQE